MDERNLDAQHRAIEHWMSVLDADSNTGRLSGGILVVAFYRGPQLVGMIRLTPAGDLVGRER